MNYGKFRNFQEFYDDIALGLDIEFFLKGIRYNISWENHKPFICICPDGDAIFFDDAQALVNSYKIEEVPLKELWQEIDILQIG